MTTPSSEPLTSRILKMVFCFSLLTLASTAIPASSPESNYAAQMQKIMENMHAGMQSTPTTAVDRQFVALMIPHHQAAIDMAELQLREGHDPRLIRIAQEIIVEQRQEIVVMKNLLESTP